MRRLFSILRLFAVFIAAFVVTGLAVSSGPQSVASAPLVQDADDGDDESEDEPTGTPAASGGYPALIAAGACGTLTTDPTFPLTNAAPRGESAGGGVFASASEVAVSVSDLLAQPHAIAIHANEDDLETAVACGSVAGQVVDGALVVGLRATNNDDLVGVAVLNDHGDTTVVELYLILAGGTAVDDAGDADDDVFDEDDADGGV